MIRLLKNNEKHVILYLASNYMSLFWQKVEGTTYGETEKRTYIIGGL